MQVLTVPQGEFHLSRYPQREKEPLRAWDAADEYLLHQIHEDHLLDGQKAVLILNDSFGALSVALVDYKPHMWSDSYLAHQGTLANLEHNEKSSEDVHLLNSLQCPEGTFDLVIIKVPKSLAFLEDQLHRLRPCLHQNTRIIGAGMSKGIHTSTLKLFERLIGPTRTSLARKKARLIFCEPTLEKAVGQNPYPKQYGLEGTDNQMLNHANVFSREKLDNGTRLLIEHIESSTRPQTIIDLGCGNGVIGIIAATRNPQATIISTDESYMAIESARVNFQSAFGDTRNLEFHVTDCLTGIPRDSADMVLCNPSFHQDKAVGDTIAWQMFVAAKNVLKQGGILQIVGNQHLAYHIKLKRLFGNYDIVTSNRKFVVLKAVRR